MPSCYRSSTALDSPLALFCLCLSLVAGVTSGCDDRAACSTDSECKGSRICVDGVCTDATVDSGSDPNDTGYEIDDPGTGVDVADNETRYPDSRVNDVGDETNPDDVDMVQVGAGPFWMGCNTVIDSQCTPSEHPYHEVMLPPFEVDRTEVTVAQYRRCVETLGCGEPSADYPLCNWELGDREDHPINCIDWSQARTYCEWAGKRLCTEAEWEKAARGDDGRIYPWGNETATCDLAVMYHTTGWGCGVDTITWPVGSIPEGASPCGAVDMAGNLYEFVQDDYHDDYVGAPRDGSAWEDDPRSNRRVMRGGEFGVQAHQLRASYRHVAGRAGHANLGFRCCRSQMH